MKCSSISAAAMSAVLAATLAAQQSKDADSHSTIEAIHKLVHAGRFDEVEAKANSIRPDDPSWKDLLDVLAEAADQRNDYNYMKRKAQEVLRLASNSDTRATAAFALGIANWRSGQPNEAVTAFSDLIRMAPGSELAYNAQGNIHEIKELGVGSPAPQFTADISTGSKLSSNDLRGKAVLLNFWASW